MSSHEYTTMLWHVDLWLGIDCEIGDCTVVVAACKQQRNGVFCAVR
jgi:hypothetical protein